MPAPSLTSNLPVVLYLDLDGVVQTEHVLHSRRLGIHTCPERAPGRVLFEWVPYLVDALAPYPEVRLVLSSSWCVWPGYSRTLKQLPELRERFVGGTYHRSIHGSDAWLRESFRSVPRGQQVWADVQRRRPREWLALDDDATGWPAEAEDRLVQCDGELGLSCPATRERLATVLRQCHERACAASARA